MIIDKIYGFKLYTDERTGLFIGHFPSGLTNDKPPDQRRGHKRVKRWRASVDTTILCMSLKIAY